MKDNTIDTGTSSCITRTTILTSNGIITFRASKPGLHRLEFDDIDESPVRREMQGWLWCSVSELVACMSNCWDASKTFSPRDIIDDFAVMNGRHEGKPYVVAVEVSESGFTIHNNHLDEMSPLQGGELWIPARWAANILQAQQLFPGLRYAQARDVRDDPARWNLYVFGPNGSVALIPKELSPIIRVLKDAGAPAKL